MPIYAFECTECGHAFDRLQKLSDPDPESCPECGRAGIKRQITAPSFRLSGSGWYETDFKKDGDKKRNLAGSGDSTAGSSNSDAGTGKASESRPSESAAKPESKPASPAPASSST